jgi:hypothetical protein
MELEFHNSLVRLFWMRKKPFRFTQFSPGWVLSWEWDQPHTWPTVLLRPPRPKVQLMALRGG